MILTSNNLDITLLVIIFIFAFLAFLKGFIKEFFSTLNLVVSIVASYLISPMISQLISIEGVPNIILQIVIRFIAFVTILIFCSIIAARVSNPLSSKIPSAINQSLGFGFGFCKGYLILSFCFAILVFFYSNPFAQIATNNQQNLDDLVMSLTQDQKFGPKWLQDSKSYNILQFGADFLSPAVKNMFTKIEYKDSINNSLLDNPDLVKKPNKELKKDIDQLKMNESKQTDDYGYNKQDIKKMQRLIEIISK
jgi:membrane protein required for colicin V production